jgi:DeoR/GlpR family transcriptional regulator of sugar metabolism
MRDTIGVARAIDSRRPVVPAERRRMILEILREHGSVSVSAVEEGFGVSPMTARRDLAILADNGYARRTHGGAVLPELAAHEDSFQSRLEQGVDTKIRLARAVIETINPHETVFVDSSSTAWYIVRELVEAALPVTVLTNSLPVMTIVGGGDVPNLEMIGLGGTFRKLTRSFVGAETVQMVQRFFVDRVVFSVKGIEADGSLTDPDPLEADVKRAMIGRARTVQFVAEAHKFDEHGLNVVVGADAVHTAHLAGASAAGQKLFRDAGAEVRLV